jgi:predicted regulator of Ras-like GTPase activity (Roadblock/LC7/MglB family)
MTPPTDPLPTLASIDVRLGHVERQVGEIHRAMVGSTDGSVKGLQSRVERLEGWLKWIGAMASAAILGAITNFVRGPGH